MTMDLVTHDTMPDTLPHTDGPGGTWSTTCLCGWSDSGTYARTNEIAEAVALRLATLAGQQHEREAGK
jgi:hypothetical protein